MKKALLTLCIVAVSFPALAINRYNIQSMSCNAVQSAVKRDGAAILRYRSARNPSLPLYDRYVRNSIFCDNNESAQISFVPTKDNPNCRVRLCKSNDFGNFGGFSD